MKKANSQKNPLAHIKGTMILVAVSLLIQIAKTYLIVSERISRDAADVLGIVGLVCGLIALFRAINGLRQQLKLMK